MWCNANFVSKKKKLYWTPVYKYFIISQAYDNQNATINASDRYPVNSQLPILGHANVVCIDRMLGTTAYVQ